MNMEDASNEMVMSDSEDAEKVPESSKEIGNVTQKDFQVSDDENVSLIENDPDQESAGMPPDPVIEAKRKELLDRLEAGIGLVKRELLLLLAKIKSIERDLKTEYGELDRQGQASEDSGIDAAATPQRKKRMRI